MSFKHLSKSVLINIGHGWAGLLLAQNATQRAKIAEKVHKPPLAVNVINFEFNGFNAFI